MSPVRARDRTMRIPLTVGLLVASMGVGFPVGAQQVCRQVTAEGRAAVVSILRTRQTTLLAAYGLSGASPDSLRPLRDSSDADRCRELNRYLGFPVALWQLRTHILASETDSVRATSSGPRRPRPQPALFVYLERAGFRYLPGEPPPLRGAFVRFLPPLLRESLVCDPANEVVDALGQARPARLSCTARTTFVAPSEPVLAMLTLSADGEIDVVFLTWELRARRGEDTIRTAILDSVYAAARDHLVRRVGPPIPCGDATVWSTADGLVSLRRPQRARRRSGDWTDNRPLPEHAEWLLFAQRGLFGECPAANARGAPR